MMNEIYEKLKVLYNTIQDANLPSDDCIISSEHFTESTMIGNETAYLRLIKSLSELLLASKKMIPPNDEYDDENGFIGFDIKRSLDEYSEVWIVSTILQNDTLFAQSVKENYEQFVSRSGLRNP